MRIRSEYAQDRAAARALTQAAFDGKPYAAGDEADIVDRLRAAGALSEAIVALEDDAVVGHCAASPADVGGQSDWFAIGPVAVAPGDQGRGIGSALVRNALARLRARGALGAVLTGAPGFYGRFGFVSRPDVTSAGVSTEHVLSLSFGRVRPKGEIVFHAAFGPPP